MGRNYNWIGTRSQGFLARCRDSFLSIYVTYFFGMAFLWKWGMHAHGMLITQFDYYQLYGDWDSTTTILTFLPVLIAIPVIYFIAVLVKIVFKLNLTDIAGNFAEPISRFMYVFNAVLLLVALLVVAFNTNVPAKWNLDEESRELRMRLEDFQYSFEKHQGIELWHESARPNFDSNWRFGIVGGTCFIPVDDEAVEFNSTIMQAKVYMVCEQFYLHEPRAGGEFDYIANREGGEFDIEDCSFTNLNGDVSLFEDSQCAGEWRTCCIGAGEFERSFMTWSLREWADKWIVPVRERIADRGWKNDLFADMFFASWSYEYLDEFREQSVPVIFWTPALSLIGTFLIHFTGALLFTYLRREKLTEADMAEIDGAKAHVLVVRDRLKSLQNRNKLFPKADATLDIGDLLTEMTPLDVAAYYGNYSLMKRLEKVGCDMTKSRALYFAAIGGHYKLTKHLRENHPFTDEDRIEAATAAREAKKVKTCLYLSVATDVMLVTQIDLSGLNMRAVPASLGMMTNLITLDLSDNNMSFMPSFLGDLKHLKNLKWSGNPLDSLSEEQKNYTTTQMIAHMQGLQKESTSWNVCKVVVLGDTNTGKSLLVRRLAKNREEWQPAPTVGIELTHFQDRGLKFNVFELGGANKQLYSSYYDFLTKRGVYVYCLNGTDPKYEEFEYWMNVISVYVTSPVFYEREQDVVLAPVCMYAADMSDAQKEAVSARVAEIVARYHLPALDTAFMTATSGKGFNKFRNALMPKIVSMRTFSAKVQGALVSAYNYITSRSKKGKNYVQYRMCKQMLQKCEVSTEFHTTYISLLHDCGVILYIPEMIDLQNWVFYDPTWLMRVITTVSGANFGDSGGFVANSTLVDTMQSLNDDREKLETLYLSLLIKFEVVVPITAAGKDRKDLMSLIPSLLPIKSAFDSHDWRGPLRPDTIRFSRIFHFKFIPKSFISRCIVNVLKDCNGLELKHAYRTGVVMHAGIAHVLLYLDPESHTLSLMMKYNGGRMTKDNKVKKQIDELPTIFADIVRVVKSVVGLFISQNDWTTNVRISSVWQPPFQQVASVDFALDELKPSVKAGSALHTHTVELPQIGKRALTLQIGSIAPGLLKKLKESALGTVDIKGGDLTGEFDGTKVRVQNWKLNMAAKKKSFISSVSVLKSVQHPNIRAPVGFVQTDEKNATVAYESIAGDVPLREYLKQHGDSLAMTNRLVIAMEALRAVMFLHEISPPIVHERISADAVLIDSSNHAQLTNFGMLYIRGAGGVAVKGWQDMAPEIYDKAFVNFGIECDIYGFGLLLLELATLTTPFDGIEVNADNKAKAIAGEYPIVSADIEPDVRAIIVGCLNTNRDDRTALRDVAVALRKLLLAAPAPALPPSDDEQSDDEQQFDGRQNTASPAAEPVEVDANATLEVDATPVAPKPKALSVLVTDDAGADDAPGTPMMRRAFSAKDEGPTKFALDESFVQGDSDDDLEVDAIEMAAITAEVDNVLADSDDDKPSTPVRAVAPVAAAAVAALFKDELAPLVLAKFDEAAAAAAAAAASDSDDDQAFIFNTNAALDDDELFDGNDVFDDILGLDKVKKVTKNPFLLADLAKKRKK